MSPNRKLAPDGPLSVVRSPNRVDQDNVSQSTCLLNRVARDPVWDTVLSGEARYMHEGELEPRTYQAHDRIFVDRWQAAMIDFPDHCWMLEYARGALPALLPFGMANTLFNSLDYVSAAHVLKIYATLAARYYRQRPDEMRKLAIGATAITVGLTWLRSRGSSRT